MPTVTQLENQSRERKQAVSMQFRLHEARKAGENTSQRQVLNALKRAKDILQQLEGDHTALPALKDTQAAKDMGIRVCWHLWLAQVWLGLDPYRKWRISHRNVRTGDIVLIKHERKYSKSGFRLAKILSVSYDEKGLVRTAVAGARPRNNTDRTKPYISKPLEQFTVSIQRLAVILPVEEQGKLLPANDDLHVCLDKAQGSSLPLPPRTKQDHAESGIPKDVAEPEPKIINHILMQEAETQPHFTEPALLQINLRNTPEPYSYTCWQCDVREQVWHQTEA